MDERQKQDLASWLAYYRELGFHDFYRRSPLSRTLVEICDDDAPGAVRPSFGTAPPERDTSPVGSQAHAGPEMQALGSPSAGSALSSIPATSDHPFVALIHNSKPRPGSQTLSLFEAPAPRQVQREQETLEQIQQDLGDCQRCKLARGRKHIVFGQGNSKAELVFVGEGPGADEDEQGLPFVGRAGQLLNKMLQLHGIRREDVYICNIVKCRPPGNRTPEKDEIDTCSPFLYRQLETIGPRLICCLGAPAVKTLLGVKEGMLRIRGQIFNFGSTKVLPTIHPAYVLRNPREERLLREDFEKIVAFLKSPR